VITIVYVAIQGRVYDVTNFMNGDHSDVPGEASNSVTTISTLVGQDLTGYFPVNPILGCSQLVTEPTLALTPKNFTMQISQAMHRSGSQAPASTSVLRQDDWYTQRFQPI
jgi:chitin synthase